MFYLSVESDVLGCEKLDEKYYSVSEKRKSKPNEAILHYDNDCTIIVLREDFQRTFPSFQTFKGAVELTYWAIKNGKLEDSELTDVTKLSDNEYLLTFKNWATFVVSQRLYDSFDTLEEKKYGAILDHMFKNCA